MDGSRASLAPRAALLSIIDSCSVGCRFCFRADKTATVMTPKDFSRTLSRLTDLGVKAVTLTGGEPLEHPVLLDLLCLSEPFPMALSIITSGKSTNALPTLKKAVQWLNGVTISADSLGAQRVGHVDRKPGGAFQLARALAPLQCTVHILAHQLTDEELEEWAVELRGSPHISIEISPLQLSESDRIRSGLSVSRCLDIVEEDISKIASALNVGEQFFARRALLVERLQRTSTESCRSSRLFVSARGELRRCPYEKQASVSIYDSRDKIKSILASKWANASATVEPRCVGVCH
jgi:molybdenum cofactor biosynthesis enzyme MoaA